MLSQIQSVKLPMLETKIIQKLLQENNKVSLEPVESWIMGSIRTCMIVPKSIWKLKRWKSILLLFAIMKFVAITIQIHWIERRLEDR